MLTQDNWNTDYYKHGNLKAMVSIGYNDNSLIDDICYFVSLVDENDNDLFQKSFKSLNDACRYANKKYASIWVHETLSKPKGSGCDSCVAH